MADESQEIRKTGLAITATLPSGLVIGSKNVSVPNVEQTITSGIVQAEKRIIAPERALTVIKPTIEVLRAGPSTLVAPTSEETIKLAVATETAPPPKRSMSELASIQNNPLLFVSREARKMLGSEKLLNERTSEVLLFLEKKKEEGYMMDDAERKTETVSYFDKSRGEKQEYTKSKPGAVETVALQIAKMASEKDFEEVAGYVLTPLSILLRNYRIKTNDVAQLPEMPDLTRELFATLENYALSRQSRYLVYEILDQITMPTSFQEQLIKRMDKFEDLDHPIAFSLTRALVAAKPDAEWITIQNERRNALLNKLDASPEELVRRFPELLKESRKLVYSGDLLSVTPGKIGIEIEFNDGSKKDESEVLHKAYRNGTRVDKGWSLGVDYELEMRKQDAALEHNTQYVDDLIDVGKWLQDYSVHLNSIHLHLDRKRHPNRPTLGEVFGQHNDAIRENIQHKTWELRGLNVPKGTNTLHPGRIEDMINFYIGACSEPSMRDGARIVLYESTDYTLERITFGHMSSYAKDAQTRLASLMTLHDSMAFRNVNPLAFIHTYAPESIDILTKALDSKVPTDFDKDMLHALRKMAVEPNTINTWEDMLDTLFEWESEEMRTILHADPSTVELYKNVFYRILEHDIQQSKHIFAGGFRALVLLSEIPGELEKIQEKYPIQMALVVDRIVVNPFFNMANNQNLVLSVLKDLSVSHMHTKIIDKVLNNLQDCGPILSYLFENRNIASYVLRQLFMSPEYVEKIDPQLIKKNIHSWDVEMQHLAFDLLIQQNQLSEQEVISYLQNVAPVIQVALLNRYGNTLPREVLVEKATDSAREIRKLALTHLDSEDPLNRSLLESALSDVDAGIRTEVFAKLSYHFTLYKSALLSYVGHVDQDALSVALNILSREYRENKDTDIGIVLRNHISRDEVFPRVTYQIIQSLIEIEMPSADFFVQFIDSQDVSYSHKMRILRGIENTGKVAEYKNVFYSALTSLAGPLREEAVDMLADYDLITPEKLQEIIDNDHDERVRISAQNGIRTLRTYHLRRSVTTGS